MASKKTWIWIIVSVIGLCVLALFVLAGAGMYFVSHHISATKSTSADALEQVDRAKALLKDQRLLIEIDEYARSGARRPVPELPTSPVGPDQLGILAWNPNEEPPRIVKVSVPFWIMRLGRRKFDVINGDPGFDFDRL